ncbi:MAG: DUF2934 domain-containing protein [Phycisphaerales bacterium]|nr:DUF2934 domain-containing protein [Phycisphaerales bacterium]
MSTPKTIVKETLNKDIQRRPESPPPIRAGAGRKVGEETHIEITPDRIRLRAYEIYQARNGGPGDAQSDWAQAERELNGRATLGSSGEDTIADPAVLEVKTRSEAQRQSATPARGGL